MIKIAKYRTKRSQYGSKKIGKKEYIDEEKMYGFRNEALKRAENLRQYGNAQINKKPYLDGLGNPYWKVYFYSDREQVMDDLKKHRSISIELVKRPKRIGQKWLGSRKISGKLYTERDVFPTESKAQSYAKELRKMHRARVIPAKNIVIFDIKTGKYKEYKNGFRVLFRRGKRD